MSNLDFGGRVNDSSLPFADGVELGGPGPTPEPTAEEVAAAVAARGYENSRAPNGRVLPLDLSRLDEDGLLRPGRRGAIYALGSGPADFHPEREPLILVHGIDGDPKNFQALVDRFKNDQERQLYVLCYDDNARRTSLNGGDMAEELRSLQRRLGPERDVTIVAHSMGGIVARRALNELSTGPGGGIDRFGDVRTIAVDTPWHGYDGPSDEGVGGFLMNFARPFMPDGFEDMRGESEMFRGLFSPELPDNVSIDLVFAQGGHDIADYTETFLKPLARSLVGLYQDDQPVRGEPKLMNFWSALLDSSQYHAFAEEARDLGDRRQLDETKVVRLLERHFPRFQGAHTSVLNGRPFLDDLAARLRNP